MRRTTHDAGQSDDVTAGQGDAASPDAGVDPRDGADCGTVGASCCASGIACIGDLRCVDGACSDCDTNAELTPRCGTFCPAGFHARAFQCDSDCGPSCIASNAVVCAPDCGATLVTCNPFCPRGYRATRSYCDLSCGTSCITANALACAREDRGQRGTFQICDTRCPDGFHIIETGCDAECGTSCITANSVTCAAG